MMDGLRMAVGTLTAVPVTAPRVIDVRVARRAMVLAPVAAIPLALLSSGTVLAGTAAGAPALLTATVAIALVVLACRGLHLDGLADTADGLSASYDRQRALEVMRRGDVGPAGAVTLLLVVLVQVAALAGAISAGHGVVAAALAALASRQVLVLCCASGVPAARRDGLGGAVAGTVPVWQVVASTALWWALCAAAAVVTGLPWWRGVLAAAAGTIAAALLTARCVRRIGGVTGDVLGGCVEVAAAAVLVALAW
ncbi:adenosylcobinamide-GDP ribazoletransferase [Haloechinothrix sp. LS1_15]|uniref:adenosylcobinamide-GDP ribazoletransferase n=1 Tax=Haloechinothrix sp. LS1_15 TaxID=2652248 RepID=UPI002947CE10|nr:adenosylcobinamide-GDP ribazoletransferase [Haloechinothrix sp. LS1_15]